MGQMFSAIIFCKSVKNNWHNLNWDHFIFVRVYFHYFFFGLIYYFLSDEQRLINNIFLHKTIYISVSWKKLFHFIPVWKDNIQTNKHTHENKLYFRFFLKTRFKQKKITYRNIQKTFFILNLFFSWTIPFIISKPKRNWTKNYSRYCERIWLQAERKRTFNLTHNI